MAMSSKVNNDLILTDPVVKSLLTAEELICVNTCDSHVDNASDSDESHVEMKPDDLQSDENPVDIKLTTRELIQEQEDDETLAQCWSLSNQQQEGQRPLTGQRAANFRLLANQ